MLTLGLAMRVRAIGREPDGTDNLAPVRPAVESESVTLAGRRLRRGVSGMHPWHDIELEQAGALRAVVETPSGSHVKYDIDRETGLLRVKRVLSSATHYPANYGFFPQTLGEDAEPLDVVVLGEESVVPGAILAVRPIGILAYVEGECRDDKIIAVHVGDPVVEPLHDIAEVPAYRLQELERFFADYRALERSAATVEGFSGPAVAARSIESARARYKVSRTA
jgi:inorganic pyrophosphatase